MREIDRLCDGQNLVQEESHLIFQAMVEGALSEGTIKEVLLAFNKKGIQFQEVAGAAKALRDAAFPFPNTNFKTSDNCGTGGDGAHTLNISTAASFVAASCGVKVAKHGNRSVSSKCGSADVFEALGVDLSSKIWDHELEAANMCFIFAPKVHTGFKHVMPARKSLGIRTIFNMLGPLVNPAKPNIQIIGVFSPDIAELMANSLCAMGTERALVIHGSGLDEIALHDKTTGFLIEEGKVIPFEVHPNEVGLKTRPVEDIKGGEPDHNVEEMRRLLQGTPSPAFGDAVAFNAGALLWLNQVQPTLKVAVEQAREEVHSGRVEKVLEKWLEVQRGTG